MPVAVEQRNRTLTREKHRTAFGRRVSDTSLPEARSRRRDDGSGQAAMRVVASDHAHRRLADLSSPNPIRWRPRADPVQKQVTGEGITLERGIDKPRPVTEARMKSGYAVPACSCAPCGQGLLPRPAQAAEQLGGRP